MSYLYGDSTPSDLTTNFLELLRDAIDFSVFVLEADEKIKAGKATATALREEADAELARLDEFIGVVQGSVDVAAKGLASSPTAQCAARVTELVSGAQRSSTDAIRGKLAGEIAAIEAEEAATRDACHEALAAFIGPHGTSDTRATQRIAFMQHGSYEATLAGASSFGLDWLFELAIPAGNLWSSQLRVERISDHFEIRAPQVAGWITKEVKVRPQRLERHTVTELTTDGDQSHVKLRIEAPVETGFDLDVDHAGAVKMTRVGASDDQSAGVFDVHPDDIPLLVDLVSKLNEAAGQFDHAKLAQAAVGDTEFRVLPTFAPLVERLVAMMAPIVRQIAARSLTPTELVLRRALGDDRREEVFVAKSTLREKYAVLPPPLRAMFSPLGLDPPPTPGASLAPKSTPTPISERPSVRAEISRSQPPPPIPRPPPPPPTIKPATPAAVAAPTARASVPPPSEGSPNKNEAFVEAVKKIVLVLKSGRTDEGYGQYAELLSSPSFTEYRADDQRQALKLLLLAKAPEGRSEAVMRAYRIALTRIQALVDAMAEPADYEMLGVAHLQLEDKPSAAAAFDIALKLERARAPSSELCSNLARRVNSL